MKVWLTTVLVLITACGTEVHQELAQNKKTAQDYLRAIYTCNRNIDEQLASDEITVSYPVFEELFKKPVLRGREEVQAFSKRFCARWRQPKLTVHESIEEDGRVVLIWGFSARMAKADGDGALEDERSWGGISLIRFDGKGVVYQEVGEESSPGPWARLDRRNAAKK